MKTLTLLFAALAALSLPARDVFLLLGQDNMSGRAKLGCAVRISTERVEKLDKDGRWVEAVEPLHFDSPAAGHGLGASFARTVADHDPSATVGLVPCAVGGSSLDDWMPGAKPFAEAVRRAKIAQRDGTVRAILWHQGDKDADRGMLEASYNARLAKMVAAIRAELGLDAAKVPFIYGSIGEFPRAEFYHRNKSLNDVMRKAAREIPNAHWVEARDMQSDWWDNVNFDVGSLRVLGERYAWAYLQTARKEPVVLRNTYSDHMLFQHGEPIVLVGRARAGTSVKATMGRASATGVADAKGRWRVELPALKPGGPHEISVRTADDGITLRDVLIGELWLCSGQSNMEMPVWGLDSGWREYFYLPGGDKIAAAANDPQLRLLVVPRTVSPFAPSFDAFGCGGWRPADSANAVESFSAAGYYFGQNLRKRLGIPVGLVDSSWGGARIEPWIPEKKLREAKLDFATKALDEARAFRLFVDGKPGVPEPLQFKAKRLAAWIKKVEEAGGAAGADLRANAMKPGYDDGKWTEGSVRFEKPSFVWFRWHVKLPENVKGLHFECRKIVDTDEAWFDGEKIGETNLEMPFYWLEPRNYPVPESCAKAGDHVLTVRVLNHLGKGGMTAPWLVWDGGRIDLAKAKSLSCVEAEPNGKTGERPYPPWDGDTLVIDPTNLKSVPSTLYNAMLAPLDAFKFRGAIWYQGCANDGDEDWPRYAACQQALVEGWREAFGRPDLAFICVQLAGFQKHRPESPYSKAYFDRFQPQVNGFVMIRPEQEKIRSVRGCECVTAVDIGEHSDIHPKNKAEVARRLDAAAANLCYGGTYAVRGPKALKAERKGAAVEITFDTPVVVKGGSFAPHEFTLAGKDGKRFWAAAELVSQKVVRVTCDRVKEPAGVDYGWVPYAPKLSLFNDQDFPTTPFALTVE